MVSVLKIPPVAVPSVYEDWLKQLLGAPLPRESKATCFDCAMSSNKTSWKTKSDIYFDEKLKCCTYTPELPNFLVGMILLSEDASMAHGRQTLLDQIALRRDATPLGIHPPSELEASFSQSALGFGRDANLLCPYYIRNEGLCGIWRYRNSACITFFCKLDRGAVGMKFWKCIRDLLLALENHLAVWSLHQINPSAADHDDWADWEGREMEFYKESGRLVAALHWNDVMSLADSRIHVLAQQVRFAYGLLKWNPLPARLTKGEFQKIEESADQVRVWTYAQNDPMNLTKQLLQAINYFDGQPIDDVVRIVAQEVGITMDRALLQTLVDYGIVVAVRL